MLDILLAANGGGTAWRHVLAEGEARAGFECVGPLGLARRLGRILGVPALPAEAPARLAAMAAKLDQHDDGTRAYSASRKQDPFGVARFLLSLRDDLKLAGWNGSPLEGSARLRDLAALERPGPRLPAGVPDVLLDLLDALKASGALPFPITVRLVSPRRAFAPLFVRMLEALAAAGAKVDDPPPHTPLAPAQTDLGRVQRALLDSAGERPVLQGDGSFLLLEADTPAEAAELTASFMRSCPLGSATCVVPTEPAVLDGALARQGLPTLGQSSSSPLRPHLQVLPLRLALAFGPQDPFRAAELLLLPVAPLAAHARRALLDALGQMPGIGSPEWLAAVGQAVIDETARAAERGDTPADAQSAGRALRDRIETWFGGETHDPVAGIPAPKAAALCAAVAAWAGGRMKAAVEAAKAQPGSAAGEDASLWSQAAAVARTLERMLIARPPGEKLPQQTLMRLHDLAVGNGSDLAAFMGEAGRPAVAGEPGGLIAPSACVIWWGFVLDADTGPGPELWTGAERTALLAADLSLAAPGERRALEAAGWRLPILSARERAVLVRWRLAGAEPVAPHAFFDELCTRVADGALDVCTVDSQRLLTGVEAPWTAPTSTVVPGAPMAQRAVWTVPAATVAVTGELSASALESFLSCPFGWALHYQAKLEPGRGIRIPIGNRLLGDFAHRILQDMLCGPDKLAFDTASADEARAWAARAFDARVGVEAAPLVRRGAEVELDRARTLVANAAASLLEVLTKSGWRAVDAERAVTGSFAGLPAAGYVDLVLEKSGAQAVIDLKLSGLEYRRDELEAGLALQTALYASMLRSGGGDLPPSGFFVLEDGQLLTVERQAFPGATVVDGPTAQETLAASEQGFRYWQNVLATGLLPVLLENLAWQAPVTAVAGPVPDEGTPARRPPPCRFCGYSAVCVPPAAEEEGEGTP